jgi:hypothetical protein
MTTLKYEVAIDAKSGVPVFFSGPFAGPTADITVFRSSLREVMLHHGLVGVADGSYQGEPDLLLVPPRPFHGLGLVDRQMYAFLAVIRVRIENLYSRLKSFKVLSTKFRHDLSLHQFCFIFVLNVVCVELFYRPLRN